MMYIELYTIKSGDYPIEPEELFSKTEYDDFLEFMEDEPSEFAPDMLSIFCEENNIDEESRSIGILAYRKKKNDTSEKFLRGIFSINFLFIVNFFNFF